MSMWARCGLHNVNILDERHLLKHITIFIPLTRSAIDNGEGQGMSVLKDNERGHRKQFINFARDIGKCRAGIGIAL